MIRFEVSGMTCDHCEQAVRKTIEAVPGVTRVVEVSREKALAVVEGDPDLSEVLEAVREEGYAAQLAP